VAGGIGTARSIYAEQAAAMIRVSRFRARSAAVFAAQLRQELGWVSLSRQAIYDWEAGRTRVPAVAILAAARVINVSVDELFAIADRFRCPRTDEPARWQETKRPEVA
jgi:transcriptional regulator with XRE-family HTH domain